MIRKLTSPFVEFGLWAGLIYSVDRLFVRMVPALRLYCYEFVVQPLAVGERTPSRRGVSIELREIRRGDPEVALMPARPDIKERRFAHDALCLGAFRKGEFIGYIWFQFRAYEEDEVRCTYVVEPADQAVFDFDLYIFPEHRMGTAFVGIWRAASRYLEERGIRHTFSRVTRFNVASVRAHRRLGAARVASAVFLQAGRVEIMMATLFPYCYVSAARSNRPRLRLRPDALAAVHT
jgi:hypothetical protein